MRLIDADKLRDEWLYETVNEPIYEPNDVLESIDNQPTVEAEVVKHGHWIVSSDVPDSFVCSECGHKYDMYKHEMSEFRCCPWCKAEMEEE